MKAQPASRLSLPLIKGLMHSNSELDVARLQMTNRSSPAGGEDKGGISRASYTPNRSPSARSGWADVYSPRPHHTRQATTPRITSLETSRRSRRVDGAPTGTLPGKDDFVQHGMSLHERFSLRALQKGPHKSMWPVNNAERGSIRIATYDILAPQVSPMGREFERLSVAVSRKGAFERSSAGCPPYRP